MSHSYEEIRAAALDVLAGREPFTFETNQYDHLAFAIGEIFACRENQFQPGNTGHYPLADDDRETYRELFWDLFRQGIISLGIDDFQRKQFPFFSVTRFGQKLAANGTGYFFHDVSSYEAAIRKEVPELNDTTLLYLKEAMQAFRSGCILSATVMLGVATEHTFLLLLDQIESNSNHKGTFSSVFKERTILQKINKFRKVVDQQMTSLPPEIKEDLDTHFAGILSIIRTFRNQAGHPTGKIMDREQTFVLLQLFIPYCKKLYQLMQFYK